MVLVDTSVWIRFLAGRRPYANALDDLLGRGEVSGHDLIYGELLLGDASGRRALLEDFAAMHRAPTVSHTEVVAFVKQRRLRGRGVGWIDAHLLASALVGRLGLWTADARLAAVARETRNLARLTRAATPRAGTISGTAQRPARGRHRNVRTQGACRAHPNGSSNR